MDEKERDGCTAADVTEQGKVMNRKELQTQLSPSDESCEEEKDFRWKKQIKCSRRKDSD